MRAAAPVLLLLALAAAPAARAERAVIVLTDGQTIEGEARPIGGGLVEVTVELASGSRQKVTLDASAIDRIEPLEGRQEETHAEALVRLHDGRELRGTAKVRRSEVVVEGPHGKVVVARHDVVSISPILPDAPRTAADADTGLVLFVPEGWGADGADAVGERLRLVRDDARAWLSVLLRPLPHGGPAIDAARIRAALRHDLSSGATIERGEGGRFLVRDHAQDHAVPGTWPLLLHGVVELHGDHLIFYRLLADGAGTHDPPPQKVLDAVVARRAWLEAGRSRDGTLHRDPETGLFLEAPAGFRVVDGKHGARVTSPTYPDAHLTVHRLDDPDPRNALLDLLDGPPEATDEVALEDGRTLHRARREGERGMAVLAPGGSVAVIIRAARPEHLAQLAGGVFVLDPHAAAVELEAAGRLLPLLVRAREAVDAGDVAAALAALEPVVAEYPEEPEARSLLVAARRAAGDADALLAELDDAWVSSGRPWVARELGLALLERARALGADDHQRALAAIERAAQVWPDESVVEAAVRLMVDAARQAFAEGNQHACWARLARLRSLVGGHEVDAVEAGLRLDAAQACLKAEDSNGARREARRAYSLGADAERVDRIYAAAETIDQRKAQAADAARRARASAGGGLVFGVPPTLRTARSHRIQPTAFTTGGGRSTRVRPVYIQNRRSNRVRPPQQQFRRGNRVRAMPSQGQSRRVRSNGILVFN
ncbi:MAG: hypothetical protein M9894_39495 [Planctomycetes bacterium]|nr:hypothetical protein [Planctomycetota bacterium]